MSKYFKSFIGKMLSSLSTFGPIKKLITYVLDKIFNNMILSKHISIEDFKNGQLTLPDIKLNIDVINSNYLLSSPYILHKAEAKKLKIILPNFSQLSTKSIQIIVDGLQLELKPNKHFQQNFKTAMQEQQNDLNIQQFQQPGEINDNPMDFFKQLIKQILFNMKIRLNNTVVKLFINEPSVSVAKTKQNVIEEKVKPQYYLMLRVPLIAIGKSQNVSYKKAEIAEEIKFDLLLPQLSLHLLKEGAKYPDYSNNQDNCDFPFTYPGVNHPSTILLVGKSKIEENKKQMTKLTIGKLTNFQQETKVMTIQGNISFIEVTINPIQLKIITRFFHQISQFKKILKAVITEQGLNDPKQLGSLSMSRKDSKGKSGTFDIFSSMASMAFIASEPSLRRSISQNKHQPQSNMLSNIMQQPEIAVAANQFNKNVSEQLQKTGEQIPVQDNYVKVNFTKKTVVNFQMDQLQINLLKYLPVNIYERLWIADNPQKKVNQSFGCAHFRISVKQLKYKFISQQKRHQIMMKYAKIHDVRLSNPQAFHAEVDEQFFDARDSVRFQNVAQQNYFSELQELKKFKLRQNQHYCMEELFRVSERQSTTYLTDKVKRYAFMPAVGKNKQGVGLIIKFDTSKKLLLVAIQEVAVMANLQIWKDLLNIIYPYFLYKQFAEKINLKSSEVVSKQSDIADQNLRNTLNNFEQEHQIISEKQKNESVYSQYLQSQYFYVGELARSESSKSNNKMTLSVTVELIYCLYRENQSIKRGVHLIEEVERKVLDYDNFQKICFCHVSQRAIFAEISQANFSFHQQNFTIGIKQLNAGFLNIKNSQISKQNPQVFLFADQIRLSKTKQKQQKINSIKTRLYLPKVKLMVELPQLITFIDMVKSSISAIDSLQGFKRSLAAKIIHIQKKTVNQIGEVKEKMKNQNLFEIFVSEVQLKMLLISVYMRSFYFQKKGKQKIIKMDVLALGLSEKIDSRLGQFTNQMLTSSYPASEKYPGILDTNLLFQVGRQTKPKNWQAQQKSSKKKLQFLALLQKQQLSVGVFMKEKVEIMQVKKKKKQEPFQFIKKNNRVNPTIQEQNNSKNISVLIAKPLYFHIENMTFLLLKKDQLKQIIEKVGKVLEEIKSQSKQIMNQRKKSIESEGETIETCIKINGGQIVLDIRPIFSFDKQKNIRVFSNMRLVTFIQINKCKISINPESQQYSLDLMINAKGYFLHHLDKEIQYNPVFLNVIQLQELGFVNILNIDSIAVIGHFCARKKCANVECNIDSVSLNMCLSSLPYLLFLFQHFSHHNLKGQYGNYYYEISEDVEDTDKQKEVAEIVTDLTKKDRELEDILDNKKKSLEQFKIQDFNLKPQSNNQKGFILIIKKFNIQKINLDFSQGKDFSFIQCQSFYESKATCRKRKEIPDKVNHILISISKFFLQVKAEKQIQILCELTRMNIIYQFQRSEGMLIWKKDNLYDFQILRIDLPLKILLNISPQYTKIKLSRIDLTAGFTDYILPFLKKYSENVQAIKKGGWKKIYQRTVNVKNQRMFLLLIPQGKITASVEYKGTMPVKDRVLYLQELTVNEYDHNDSRKSQIINQWLIDFVKRNMGTLVSGLLFEALSSCIGFIINGIRFVLGLFFPFFKS